MKPPSRGKLALLWICAGLSLALLLGTYAVAAMNETWPRGHPWHGIALAAMSAFFASQTRLHRGGNALRVIAVLLPLVAMGAMAMAILEARS